MDNTKQPVLAMYDVRGIQEYIFRTNKMKEIMGASKIIENIFETILEKALRIIYGDKFDCNVYRYKWYKYNDYRFDGEAIEMEVIYSAAGNTYIVFKNKDMYREVTKIIVKKMIEDTYGLKLTYAMIPKTDNFLHDHENINKQLNDKKDDFPIATLAGSFPITRQDTNTGFPLSESVSYKNGKYTETEYLSRESYLKREAFRKSYDEKDEKHLDSMVIEKGSESLLAIVHIDGNSMGDRIRNDFPMMLRNLNKTSYKDAVPDYRKMSLNIKNAFNVNAFNKMIEALDRWLESDKCIFKNITKENGEYKKYLRPVINAGDDVTFVCNAKVALSLCEIYLENIKNEAMWTDLNLTENENYNKYGFSACAGIAIINSHFPFYEAYMIAEKCCESAKKRAKQKENLKDEKVGNYIDFQICRAMMNFENNRERKYILPDGTNLLMRPYSVDTPSGEKYSFADFKNAHNHFFTMQRSWAKEFLRAYSVGEYDMKISLSEAKSRQVTLPDNEDAYEIINEIKTAKYYDALEMLDLFVDIMETGGDAS